MSSFKDIQAELDKQVKEANGAVAQKGAAPVNAKGLPQINVGGTIGTQVAQPGTEQLALDGSTFAFIECISAAPGKDKKRYVIVEKGKKAKYGNQYIISTGERAHIVTRDLYVLMLAIINSAGKQLNDMNRDIQIIAEQRDLYKMTIDSLRKNGVID